jgi:septum site-determining protein MinD
MPRALDEPIRRSRSDGWREEALKSKVIVVTSGKGGVGKTTTTANIGAGLARVGEKVAVIDVDVGLRNLDVVMGLEGRVVFDLVDVLEGKCRLRQALIRDKRVENLHLLPASQTRDKDALNPEGMLEIVRQCIEEEGMDRVLIDSPAGIERGFQTAAAAAHGALVVVNPEVSSVRDADRIIGLLEARDIRESRLVINRLRPKMVAKGDMLSVDDIVEILSVKPIGIIPEDEGILVSTNVGEPAVLGSSRAGQAFRDTARRIHGEEVPFPNLDERQGFMARLSRMFGGG